MKRADLEKAFAELDLEEMSSLLSALTEIHHTRKEARVAELEAEIARLRGRATTSSTGGGHVVGNPRSPDGRKRASPAAKYRSKKNPNLTFSGRGGVANWLKAEMAETGLPMEAFLIDQK